MPFGKGKSASKSAGKKESNRSDNANSPSKDKIGAKSKNDPKVDEENNDAIIHYEEEEAADRQHTVPSWETVAGSIKPRHSEVPVAKTSTEEKSPKLDPLHEEDPKGRQNDKTAPPNIVEDNPDILEETSANKLRAEEVNKNQTNGDHLISPAAGQENASKSPTPIPDSVADRKVKSPSPRNRRQANLQAIPETSFEDSKRSDVNVGGTKSSKNTPRSGPSRSKQSQDENLKESKSGGGGGGGVLRKSDSSATEDIRGRMILTEKRSSPDPSSNRRPGSSYDENYNVTNKKTRKSGKTGKSSRSPVRSKSGADEVVNWKFTQNRTDHLTSVYDDQFLIVRRGFPIKFSTSGEIQRLKLYNIPSKYSTQCTTEPPRYMIEVTLTLENPECAGWKIEKLAESDYSLQIPAKCIIGLWLVKIRVDGEDYREDIRILFNPWCREDEVYLADDDMRQEYVLSESGRVYTNGLMFYPWFFGQFEHRVLDIVLYLLDRSSLSTSAKCNAVAIARALCLGITHGDGEVITGRWQEPYTGGYDPKHWHSSVDILNRFYRSRKSVSYGQCWVFSAIFVTVMRALGIPSRTVTNNFSFHDSNRSSVCEWEILHDGHIKNMESIWNFHVWAEVWMERHDIDRGYGGWQAVDATPQEMSADSSIAGPTPVKAIKEGALEIPYNTVYLFTEVNSDIAYWKRERDLGLGTLIKFDEGKIGQKIVTKQVLGNNAENITESYKLTTRKKSIKALSEEKSRLLSAVNPGVNFSMYEPAFRKKTGVEIQIDVPDYVAIGNDFHYSIDFIPTDSKSGTAEAKICISVFVSTNTGKFIGQVMKTELNKQKISKGKPISGKVDYIKYRRFACASYCLKIFVMCELSSPNEGQNCDFAAIPFYCKPPEILVMSKAPFVQGEPVDIKLSFVNEFKFGLSGCYYELSAPRMKPKAFGIKKGLGSGESCYIHLQYKPKRAGQIMLIAKFGCREITITCGSVELFVEKKIVS